MFITLKNFCTLFAFLSIIIVGLYSFGVAGEHAKRVYELSREDFTTAETLSSLSVSVFGVRLGTSYGQSERLAQVVGRPVRGWASSLDRAIKAVYVFYSDKELKTGKSMVTFESANGETVTKIGLIGMISGGLRGFERIAVGDTRSLLVRCNTDRTRVLGKEDEEEMVDRDKVWAKTYSYHKEGIHLTYAIDVHPTDPNASCSLVFVHPARKW